MSTSLLGSPNLRSPDLGSLDREAALKRVGGDHALLKEIAGLFLEHQRVWIVELREAAACGDVTKVEQTAHNLKGSVSNFGARNAVEASVNLENVARSSDLPAVSSALAALELTLETLCQDLATL
jgi:HPt (histidine-containing phosphotransfer) domain-containing protein